MRIPRPLIVVLWLIAVASVAAYAWLRLMPVPQPREAGIQIVVEKSAQQPGPEESLPVLFKAPAFSLTDHHGRAFSSTELQGKVWIGFIFLTNCPTGACPVMVRKMAALQQTLPDERIHFVSFSIDPQRDTPDGLAEYARRMGGAEVSERWHLLTGQSADQMKDLATEMKLAVGEGWGHSTIFLLVDQQGNVRASFGNEDPEGMTRLRESAEKLLAQRP
jgi:protein SCO1/2